MPHVDKIPATNRDVPLAQKMETFGHLNELGFATGRRFNRLGRVHVQRLE